MDIKLAVSKADYPTKTTAGSNFLWFYTTLTNIPASNWVCVCDEKLWMTGLKNQEKPHKMGEIMDTTATRAHLWLSLNCKWWLIH